MKKILSVAVAAVVLMNSIAFAEYVNFSGINLGTGGLNANSIVSQTLFLVGKICLSSGATDGGVCGSAGQVLGIVNVGSVIEPVYELAWVPNGGGTTGGEQLWEWFPTPPNTHIITSGVPGAVIFPNNIQLGGSTPNGNNSADYGIVDSDGQSAGAPPFSYKVLTGRSNTLGNYWTDINDLIGSTNQFWQAVTGGINYSGGNVGIGTNTPSEALYVVGKIKASSNIVSVGGNVVAAAGKVQAVGNIESGANITASGSITSIGDISTARNVTVGQNLSANGNVTVGKTITATGTGNIIAAGTGITTTLTGSVLAKNNVCAYYGTSSQKCLGDTGSGNVLANNAVYTVSGLITPVRGGDSHAIGLLKTWTAPPGAHYDEAQPIKCFDPDHDLMINCGLQSYLPLNVLLPSGTHLYALLAAGGNIYDEALERAASNLDGSLGADLLAAIQNNLTDLAYYYTVYYLSKNNFITFTNFDSDFYSGIQPTRQYIEQELKNDSDQICVVGARNTKSDTFLNYGFAQGVATCLKGVR